MRTRITLAAILLALVTATTPRQAGSTDQPSPPDEAETPIGVPACFTVEYKNDGIDTLSPPVKCTAPGFFGFILAWECPTGSHFRPDTQECGDGLSFNKCEVDVNDPLIEVICSGGGCWMIPLPFEQCREPNCREIKRTNLKGVGSCRAGQSGASN